MQDTAPDTPPAVTCYGIKNCDTMKKAFAWLDEHGVAYTFHDYKKSGIDSARLHAWSQAVGLEGPAQHPWPHVEEAR